MLYTALRNIETIYLIITTSDLIIIIIVIVTPYFQDIRAENQAGVANMTIHHYALALLAAIGRLHASP